MVIFQAYVYLNFLICTLIKDQILPEQQILIIFIAIDIVISEGNLNLS